MRLWTELLDAERRETTGERVQAGVFELLVLRGALDDLWVWTQIIPQHPGLLAPTGIARHLDVSFMLDASFTRANAWLTAALLLLGALRLWRAAYLAALVTYHLHFVARYSLGKVGHGSNVLGFALLALGTAHVAFRDPTLRRRAAIAWTLVLLSIGYTWAAIVKLSRSGVLWVDGHHLALWIREKWVDTTSMFGARQSNFLQRMAVRNAGISTVILSFGLLTELTSGLVMLRRFRRFMLLALAAMHIGIMYSMNIIFPNNIYLLLSLGLPIAELVDWTLARIGRADTERAAGPWGRLLTCAAQ